MADYVDVAPEYGTLDDPDSLLTFYRTLIHLRRETPALVAGDYLPLQKDDAELLVFLRRRAVQSCLVVLNFGAEASTLESDPALSPGARILFGTHHAAGEKLPLPGLRIAPFGILVAQV